MNTMYNYLQNLVKNQTHIEELHVRVVTEGILISSLVIFQAEQYS